jgi:hypothetical protein
MEQYKIIATIKNSSTIFELAFLPENFEGVKISQTFSFINPIGYNPKFSVDTMRIIEGDKLLIDNTFLTYGLQSDVELEIYELNNNGQTYDTLATFAIDFESYEIQDYFSEFALKSVSVLDFYNGIKNTERTIALPFRSSVINVRSYIPNTQLLQNTVSLKSIGIEDIVGALYFVPFTENKQSKIYNADSALYDELRTFIYTVNSPTAAHSLEISVELSCKVLSLNPMTTLELVLVRTHRTQPTTETVIKTWIPSSAAFTIDEVVNASVLPAQLLYSSTFQLALKQSGATMITALDGSLFVDCKKKTDKFAVGVDQYIWFDRLGFLLGDLFNGLVDYPAFLDSTNFTSANCIMTGVKEATIKPSTVLNDACKLVGLILNYKLDGTVELKQISDYFNSLLNTANAIEITDFKDFSISYYNELNYKSVEVGQESKDYDVFTYNGDINKRLTFTQSGRSASEVLDLSPSTLRSDFSGIIDYYFKRSKQDKKNSKDLFLYNFNTRTASNGEQIHDNFTPRDVLENWRFFLSFCFQNFGQNTLTISSDGGTADNYVLGGVAQMADFTLSQTKRLLPIQINFTGLIPKVDFSEKLLKINKDGEIFYIFVTKAETTDKLSEQQISGLRVQF